MNPNEPYSSWPRVESPTTEEFERMGTEDTSRLFMVFMLDRTECRDAMARLEGALYPPGSDRNKCFELWMTYWQGLPFVVAAVPLQDRGKVELALFSMKMRLEDGVPTLLHSKPNNLQSLGSTRGKHPDQVAIFPLRSPRTFTLAPKRQSKGPTGAGIHMQMGEAAGAEVLDAMRAEVEKIVRQYQAKRN